MFKEHLEQLFEFVAKNIPSQQIMEAKKEYQKTTGEIYEDDKSYNTRMALFLEWYLLDTCVPGTEKTVLEDIIENNKSSWTPSHLEIYQQISDNIEALFEVKKIKDDSVTVLDLYRDEKYLVDEKDSKLVFRKNDIFQGRIVPHQGKWFFTGNYCFHPDKTHRYIKSDVKPIYKLHMVWKKELKNLEKELSKFQSSILKISNTIDKLKTKYERADFGSTKKDKLEKELILQEENRAEMETNVQQKNNEIEILKNEKIKLEGRKLITDMINKLAYMNLKWERSRQIEILDIYKN